MLTNLILAAGLVVWVVECFLAYPFKHLVERLVALINRACSIVVSPAYSDCWKEKALALYAGRMIVSTLKLSFGFFLAFSPLILLEVVHFNFIESTSLLYSWPVLLLQVVLGVAWYKLRSRGATSQDYSFADQLFHRLILSNAAVSSMLLKLDLRFFKWPDETATVKGAPVFVTGLARAGTTLVMRVLHDSGQFRSLTYADMPMVLSTNLWQLFRKFSFRKRAALKERAHGDGLMVSFDSPEAFEEVFWKQEYGHKYIKSDGLYVREISHESIDLFKKYIAVTAREKRYLSKNNNNLLRLGALKKAFPEALVVVPFRDPAEQAISLHAQHSRFVEKGKVDPFGVDYMNWLAHHEFGANHKPFCWQSCSGFSPVDPNYWLAMWIDTYRYVVETDIEVIWLAYESLCEEPAGVVGALYQQIGLSRSDYALEIRPLKRKADRELFNAELLEEAQKLYEKLCEFTKSI